MYGDRGCYILKLISSTAHCCDCTVLLSEPVSGITASPSLEKKKEQKNKSVTNQCKYFKIKIALTSLKFVFFFEYYLNDSLVSQFSHQKKPESVH